MQEDCKPGNQEAYTGERLGLKNSWSFILFVSLHQASIRYISSCSIANKYSSLTFCLTMHVVADTSTFFHCVLSETFWLTTSFRIVWKSFQRILVAWISSNVSLNTSAALIGWRQIVYLKQTWENIKQWYSSVILLYITYVRWYNTSILLKVLHTSVLVTTKLISIPGCNELPNCSTWGKDLGSWTKT